MPAARMATPSWNGIVRLPPPAQPHVTAGTEGRERSPGGRRAEELPCCHPEGGGRHSCDGSSWNSRLSQERGSTGQLRAESVLSGHFQPDGLAVAEWKATTGGGHSCSEEMPAPAHSLSEPKKIQKCAQMLQRLASQAGVSLDSTTRPLASDLGDRVPARSGLAQWRRAEHPQQAPVSHLSPIWEREL